MSTAAAHTSHISAYYDHVLDQIMIALGGATTTWGWEDWSAAAVRGEWF